MIHTIDNLILDLIEWVGRKDRTYHETMDAWRTSCPRLTIWEDASDGGYVKRVFENKRSMVRVTSAGIEFLKSKRPHIYEQLQHQKTFGG